MKLTCLLVITLALSSFQSYGAKKHCAGLFTKLHNIQSQQRQGHSLKKSDQLRKKEDLARKQWWDCENNRNKPERKKKKLKLSKTTINKKMIKRSYLNKSKEHAPIFHANDIVIKSKYKGDKQIQWLNFYKRSRKCARPKTTQVFAYCMEDKAAQQKIFEQQY